MSRPKWPSPTGPLPVETIRDIRERQQMYDQDPAAYERMEAARQERIAEERQLEQEMLAEEERKHYERTQANDDSDLPF